MAGRRRIGSAREPSELRRTRPHRGPGANALISSVDLSAGNLASAQEGVLPHAERGREDTGKEGGVPAPVPARLGGKELNPRAGVNGDRWERQPFRLFKIVSLAGDR